MDEPIITPSQQRPTDSKQELERQFTIFAILWALASMLVTWHRFAGEATDLPALLIHSAAALAAVALLIRPTWVIACVLIGALHVVYAFRQMPFASSTDIIWLFFGGVMAISFLSTCLVRRSFAVSPIGLFRSVAPCLRIVFLISLTALGIARLNWGFIRLESSPVVAVLSQFRGDAMVPHSVFYLTISMLLVVDLFLVAALLIPGLRRFAVGFGSCYFAWQALIGFGEARVMLPIMLVGLYLFTSTQLVGRVYAAFHRWIPLPAVRNVVLPVLTILLSIAVIALSLTAEDARQPTNQQVVTAGYAVFVLVWCTALVTSLIDARPRLIWVSWLSRNPLLYLWVGLFVMLAAAPYLGLGTWGRLSDFSGLQTFGGQNNHLFIPQTYLVGYQNDLVEVVSSSDAYLDRLSRDAELLTWFDLVNYLNEHPETSLTFIRNDERFQVPRAGDIAELSTENHWILRKLIGFRPIQLTAPTSLTGHVARVEDR